MTVRYDLADAQRAAERLAEDIGAALAVLSGPEHAVELCDLKRPVTFRGKPYVINSIGHDPDGTLRFCCDPVTDMETMS